MLKDLQTGHDIKRPGRKRQSIYTRRCPPCTNVSEGRFAPVHAVEPFEGRRSVKERVQQNSVATADIQNGASSIRDQLDYFHYASEVLRSGRPRFPKVLSLVVVALGHHPTSLRLPTPCRRPSPQRELLPEAVREATF